MQQSVMADTLAPLPLPPLKLRFVAGAPAGLRQAVLFGDTQIIVS